MENLAVIHAGPAAQHLKSLVRALHSVGVRETYFMTDLIETLKYKDEFKLALTELSVELTFGQYAHQKVYNALTEASNELFLHKDLVSEFLHVTANTTSAVAKYLHETLVTQGRYDENGTFPYEFDRFDGRIIYLRHL